MSATEVPAHRCSCCHGDKPVSQFCSFLQRLCPCLLSFSPSLSFLHCNFCAKTTVQMPHVHKHTHARTRHTIRGTRQISSGKHSTVSKNSTKETYFNASICCFAASVSDLDLSKEIVSFEISALEIHDNRSFVYIPFLFHISKTSEWQSFFSLSL